MPFKIKPIYIFIIFFVLSVSSILFFYKEQKKFLNSIIVEGNEYIFNTNLYEVVNVPSDNDEKIKDIVDKNNKICIKFDNSSETDNAIFAKVSFNMVFKLTKYYYTRGELKKFEVCNEAPIIELVGPNTGAEENSLRLVGEKIIIQGRDKKEIEMAADKLVLIVFDVKLDAK